MNWRWAWYGLLFGLGLSAGRPALHALANWLDDESDAADDRMYERQAGILAPAIARALLEADAADRRATDEALAAVRDKLRG